jgi:hypothetical protein
MILLRIDCKRHFWCGTVSYTITNLGTVPLYIRQDEELKKKVPPRPRKKKCRFAKFFLRRKAP